MMTNGRKGQGSKKKIEIKETGAKKINRQKNEGQKVVLRLRKWLV